MRLWAAQTLLLLVAAALACRQHATLPECEHDKDCRWWPVAEECHDRVWLMANHLVNLKRLSDIGQEEDVSKRMTQCFPFPDQYEWRDETAECLIHRNALAALATEAQHPILCTQDRNALWTQSYWLCVHGDSNFNGQSPTDWRDVMDSDWQCPAGTCIPLGRGESLVDTADSLDDRVVCDDSVRPACESKSSKCEWDNSKRKCQAATRPVAFYPKSRLEALCSWVDSKCDQWKVCVWNATQEACIPAGPRLCERLLEPETCSIEYSEWCTWNYDTMVCQSIEPSRDPPRIDSSTGSSESGPYPSDHSSSTGTSDHPETPIPWPGDTAVTLSNWTISCRATRWTDCRIRGTAETSIHWQDPSQPWDAMWILGQWTGYPDSNTNFTCSTVSQWSDPPRPWSGTFEQYAAFQAFVLSQIQQTGDFLSIPEVYPEFHMFQPLRPNGIVRRVRVDRDHPHRLFWDFDMNLEYVAQCRPLGLLWDETYLTGSTRDHLSVWIPLTFSSRDQHANAILVRRLIHVTVYADRLATVSHVAWGGVSDALVKTRLYAIEWLTATELKDPTCPKPPPPTREQPAILPEPGKWRVSLLVGFEHVDGANSIGLGLDVPDDEDEEEEDRIQLQDPYFTDDKGQRRVPILSSNMQLYGENALQVSCGRSSRTQRPECVTPVRLQSGCVSPTWTGDQIKQLNKQTLVLPLRVWPARCPRFETNVTAYRTGDPDCTRVQEQDAVVALIPLSSLLNVTLTMLASKKDKIASRRLDVRMGIVPFVDRNRNSSYLDRLALSGSWDVRRPVVDSVDLLFVAYIESPMLRVQQELSLVLDSIQIQAFYVGANNEVVADPAVLKWKDIAWAVSMMPRLARDKTRRINRDGDSTVVRMCQGVPGCDGLVLGINVLLLFYGYQRVDHDIEYFRVTADTLVTTRSDVSGPTKPGSRRLLQTTTTTTVYTIVEHGDGSIDFIVDRTTRLSAERKKNSEDIAKFFAPFLVVVLLLLLALIIFLWWRLPDKDLDHGVYEPIGQQHG